MAERKVTVAVDIVQTGNGSKVRTAVGSVEQEVIASQKRIAQGAKTTNRIIEESDKAQARSKKFLAKQQADDFIRELRRVERERKRAETDVKSTSPGFGAIVGGSFLGNVGANALSNISSQLRQAGSAVFEFSSRLEQSKIGFTSLMGNAALAADHIKELQKVSTDFPLEFSSLAKMSQRLQGAGIEARKIVPLIKDIGNIAAATGDLSAERMEGIGVALSQIASKGRVSAEEMEQLAERGIPAWRMLSEAIGKTAGETRKMAEDGKISSQQLFDAFQKFSRLNFGDAMKKQANTFSGAMQQIKNVLMLTASTAFEPLYKEISSIAIKANKDIQKQKGDFDKMGSTIGEAVGKAFGIALGAAIRVTFKELFQKPMTYYQTGDMGAFFSSMFGLGKGTATGIGGLGGTAALPGQYNIDYSRPGAPQRRTPSGAAADSGSSSKAAISTILNAMREAMMIQESGGNPRAINTRTQASGLFQVLPSNIGPWTEAVFGKGGRMSQSDFLSSPRAQEAVFEFVMGQYLETARQLAGGNEDVAIRMAAAAWYGGPGAMRRYNDPTKFRANEPSIAQYTTQVLDRTKRARVMGNIPSITEVTGEVEKAMETRSDIASENAKRTIANTALEIYRRSGILPSKEMLDTLQRMMIEDARRTGTVQPTDEAFRRTIASIWSSAPIEMRDVPLSGVTPQNRPLEENPYPERIAEFNREIWDQYHEEQERAFEDTRRDWEDLLTSLAEGDFKSVWRQFKSAMLQQFIQPASAYLTQMFGSLGGLFGGMNPSFAGGSMPGMGPGGTPYFNPSANGGFANFAPTGGMGGGIGGGSNGLFGGLFNKFFGGGKSAPKFGHEGIHMAGMGGGKGIGGMIRGMGGGSMLGGIASIGGMAASMIGGAVGGKWGNFLSLAGTGVAIGAQFGGPMGALIGGAIGAGAGLISMLFGRDNATKKLKEAALSTYGITVKDKSILNALKSLGESMFGKGKVGENAVAVVSSDQGQNILRNYAEATGQSSKMIDRLYMGDENWSGNQFRSNFGGFRAFGGPVSRGFQYVVGERGPELFTPSQSGNISPTVGAGDQQLKVILGQVEETVNLLNTHLKSMSAGKVLAWGVSENPEAVGAAVVDQVLTHPKLTEAIERGSGRAF